VKDIWPWKQEGTVNITIYDVPEGLLRELVEKVINPDYPGGISPAIKDVILKAVEERKRQEARIATVKEL
jgi:hypothetical protein